MLTTAGLSRAAMSAKLIEVGDGDVGAGDSAIGAGLPSVIAAASGSRDGDTLAVLGTDNSRPSNTPMIAVSVAVVTTNSRVMIGSLYRHRCSATLPVAV